MSVLLLVYGCLLRRKNSTFEYDFTSINAVHKRSNGCLKIIVQRSPNVKSLKISDNTIQGIIRFYRISNWKNLKSLKIVIQRHSQLSKGQDILLDQDLPSVTQSEVELLPEYRVEADNLFICYIRNTINRMPNLKLFFVRSKCDF
jgi:hypothetical protein